MWHEGTDTPSSGAALAEAVHRQLLGSEEPPEPTGIVAAVRSRDPLLPLAEVSRVAGAVAARIGGLGPLERCLADPSVTEVMVNGPGEVWVERHGALARTGIELDQPGIDLLVERIVAPLGLRVDRAAPVAEARLPDGSRVHIVLAPLAVDGTSITIRRFGARPVPLAELCPPGVAELLTWAVRSRANLLVSGGTGAGKTTLLNALCGLLEPNERVITIEDAAELRLPGDHVVRLEARRASADGVGEVSVRDLVRAALRMRPDRIIVGEVRGPEALDMLQAMNTGHEGSLSTCHANGCEDALRRLETMVLQGATALPLAAVRDQIHASVDLLVHLVRGDGARRRVAAVAEVGTDPSAAPGERTRLLADGSGLLALPARDARRPGVAAPNAAWLGG
jgi:pilus assembly protein CpaF